MAFTTRMYYPPGDRRISLHQVYVANFDGSERRSVSDGKHECECVRWVGRDQLAWIEFEVHAEDELGSHADHGKASRLMLLDRRTGKRRVLRTGMIEPDSVERSFTGTWQRGRAFYSANQHRIEVFASGRVTPSPDVFQERAESGRPLWALIDGSQAVLSDERGLGVTQSRGGALSESDSPVFIRARRRHTFPIPGEITRLLASKVDPLVTWAVAGNYAGSAGCEESIYKMDWNRDRVFVVVDDLYDIDFQADSPYYAGFTNPKSTKRWGSKRVWATDAYVGDTATAKRSLLLAELSQTTSVTIQPEQ